MNQLIRNIVGGALAIGLLMTGYAIIKFSESYNKSIQSKQPTAFLNFSTSGEGRVVGVPDIAQFSFTVNTEGGKNVKDLQTANAEKTNKAIAFMKEKMKVDAKDIHTTEYRVNPRYQYFPCDRRTSSVPCRSPEHVGYTVRQTVRVKIRNFQDIGDILSGVVQNGANEVSELSFVIDDPSGLQQQAREEAIGEAKKKAKAVADAAGFRLGRLLSIQEGYERPDYEREKYLDIEAAGSNIPLAVAPSIEAGSQEIRVQVTLKYEIE